MTDLASRRVQTDDGTAPAGWDDAAVSVPGGHALQSAAWAEYRRSRGVEPRYLSLGDGSVALASVVRSSMLPGVEVSVRRGPAHRGDGATVAAERSLALSNWARDHGARELFLDPERDADPSYEKAMDVVGFEVSPGLEPSIHVMRLPLGGDADALWSALSKSARQRVRAAESAATTARLHDTAAHLPAFAALLRERADALDIGLMSGTEYLRGWKALLEAGHARFLVAEHEDELLGGLFLYRHGGIHATAYSADAASRRRDLPGTMHLLRWTAIKGALEDGASAIELGGVDLPGRRHPPEKGDPNRGLYEHKRSFGAEWVYRAPARRMILRPWATRLAAARRGAVDATRRMRR